MGSSLLMEMKVKQVLNRQGISFEIEHCSVGEAVSIAGNFDLIFCPRAFADSFAGVREKVKVIPLQNVLSEEEIEEKCRENQIF